MLLSAPRRVQTSHGLLAIPPRARAGDFVVPGMASTPPAERHLILTTAVKRIARSFTRRRLEPILSSLSWKGGGGKEVLYGDDKYKKADVQYAS